MDLIIVTTVALFLVVQGIIAIAAVFIARNTGAIVKLLQAGSPAQQYKDQVVQVLKLGQRPSR
ncbi:MAG TPA: hypothetical protein VMP11_05615 [Verrucomicrobiae bacterium]|nr:hypothetical protein [Verrucomicrobiae bacterium]